MALYLRKVIYPRAHDNYCVVQKLDEGEFEIGSRRRQRLTVIALKVQGMQ